MKYNLRLSHLMNKYSSELVDLKSSIAGFYTVLNSNLEENFKIINEMGLKQYKTSILNKLFNSAGLTFSGKTYICYLPEASKSNLDRLKLKSVELENMDFSICLNSLLLNGRWILKDLPKIFLMLELNVNYSLFFRYILLIKFLSFRFSFLIRLIPLFLYFENVKKK